MEVRRAKNYMGSSKGGQVTKAGPPKRDISGISRLSQNGIGSKVSSGVMAMNQNRYSHPSQNNYQKQGLGSSVLPNASFDDSQFESDYDADANGRSINEQQQK